MTAALFDYPKQAAFLRPFPKSKIYEHAQPSRALRERFVSEISQIVWQYKLSPETINLPARPGVTEIQVFGITLKTDTISDAVLRCIDKATPFPIFFELTYEDRIKATAAYKRPSEADAGKWVVGDYFETPWLAAYAVREPLPIALDLAGLYEQMLRRHIERPARSNESLPAHIERISEIRRKEQDLRKLEVRLQREVQFNRKVELNAELRGIKQELDRLRSGIN